MVLVLWGTFRTLALTQDDLDSVFCSLVFFLHALLSCLSPPEKYKAERKAAGMVAQFANSSLCKLSVQGWEEPCVPGWNLAGIGGGHLGGLAWTNVVCAW